MSQWNCTMYHERVNDGCYEGECKLDGSRCHRNSNCKPYISSDNSDEESTLSRKRKPVKEKKTVKQLCPLLYNPEKGRKRKHKGSS